ncbi:3-hydroxyacyl-[acyl-carrier-protein] dehydratase [Saccharothrix ecbatanensis]|uniref:3-hydroxyacyl-[acyl-carrier-protein] dehydratase n=1 Tax=Saccharothrix ecbatanensis TaxID=1105145 RepID=A0A7W9HF91_9PSEU|nr:hypothetical protein [Saccharothrix ecbatanensis]MBB5800873.1 3-hydroxyacyl-[acyl-carrier-protein] dehydratase [Saccharothrix ecbatanensis]
MNDLSVRAVRAAVNVLVDTDPTAETPGSRTSLHITADEPCFEGHYPGFPILPGVCVIESVHRSALATHPERATVEHRLAAIETARFLQPVYPDDVITVDMSWQRRDGAWRCRAVVGNPRGESARVRLRYEPAESTP